MKTETLQQAINYTLGNPQVQGYIAKMEAQPKRFVIVQIAATVANVSKNIIRIYINFNESGNPNGFKEDAIIDIREQISLISRS